MVTPEKVATQLAWRIRELRLRRKWKQATLAQHAGVTLASLRRFEQTGHISLKNLLRLSFALGRLSDYEGLLQPPAASSLAELEASLARSPRQRGTK